MKTYRIILSILLVVAGLAQAGAQSSNSPYSRYGYGLLRDNATSAQRAMGGVGYAMSEGRQVNVMNPASYAATDSLTFLWDFGLDLSYLRSSEGDKSGNSFGGGLDYLTMQFPITKIMGGSIGLVPYSSVGYSFGSAIDNGSEARTGSGGLNQLYLGYAIRPFGGLSLGANVSYLFGTCANSVYSYTSSGSSSLFDQVVQVRDYNLQFGAQYSLPINHTDRVTLGAVYSPKKTLHGNAWATKADLSASKVDTIGYSSLGGNYGLPSTYGVGLSYCKANKLMVEADVTFQQWKDVKYGEIEELATGYTQFDDRYKVALGAQYIPNYRGGYGKRISYRFGAYYNHDYLNVRGNNVRDYGVSFGVGLPVPSGKSVVNLGVEYKHRYSAPNDLIKENYINFTLGITFNELWFWQSKIR